MRIKGSEVINEGTFVLGAVGGGKTGDEWE